MCQATKRLSEVQFNILRSLQSWLIVMTPILEHLTISLWYMPIYLLIDVLTQESSLKNQTMDPEIILGGDGEFQLHTPQVSRVIIHSLVVHAFDMMNSCTD